MRNLLAAILEWVLDVLLTAGPLALARRDKQGWVIFAAQLISMVLGVLFALVLLNGLLFSALGISLAGGPTVLIGALIPILIGSSLAYFQHRRNQPQVEGATGEDASQLSDRTAGGE